ncbi:unnamed protein product [Acanthoscelides obtectus]|uniref:Uncharacterized protein n=1 Tax=Acanthoscelides obtectus TaxID=200917 RepID=A0A9P0PSZ4_ACAOB|nr:unnamed protein product [Acanthoscelides obtectus]CAK1654652.1 hypothetical protein AOBTE_LOCUS18740 [Acanthoscelides obtectus]
MEEASTLDCFFKMFKCIAVLLVAAVAVSNAVPIGIYRGAYGVNPLYRNTLINDYYPRNIFGGYPYYKRFDLGYGDYDDWCVTGDCDIYNTFGTYGTIDDLHRREINDRFVPEVLRKYTSGGKIYDVVKKNQLGDVLELNDKHKLENVHLLAGQNTVRDLLNEQQEKVLEDKEILDRLNLKEQLDMEKQKEKLAIMQKIQKEQLDKVHAIEDAKITGMVPDVTYMRNIYGVPPYTTGYGYNDVRTGIFRGIY